MHRPVVLFFATIGIALAGCAPSTLATSGQTTGEDATDGADGAPELEPVKQAEAIIGPMGLAANVVSIELHGGLLQVTLDRTIRTLGDSDLYFRACNGLNKLIATEGRPTAVKGVQVFGVGGAPIAATGAPGAPCEKLYR